jgi:hypothetical protein
MVTVLQLRRAVHIFLGVASISLLFTPFVSGSQANVSGLQFSSQNVVILPGARYVVVAPTAATVVRAPEYGKVYDPVPYPDETDPIYVPGILDQEQEAGLDIAVLKYQSVTANQFAIRQQQITSFDTYLANYGQHSRAPTSFAPPWQYTSDRNMKNVILAAVNILKHDHDYSPDSLAELRKTIKAAPVDGLVPESLEVLTKKVTEEIGTPIEFSTGDWLQLLDKAIVYVSREWKGLNSSSYLVSYDGVGDGNIEPNVPASGDGNFSFVVPRWLDRNQSGARNLDVFCDYWKKVTTEDLYSDGDAESLKEFARIITLTKQLPSEVKQLPPEVIANFNADWKTVSKTLVRDCDDAISQIGKWRQVEVWLYAGFGCEVLPAAGLSDGAIAKIKTMDPSISDDEVRGLKGSLLHACSIAAPNAAAGRPASADQAKAWVADEYRDARSFKGTLIRIRESSGIIGVAEPPYNSFGALPPGPTHVFELLKIRNFRNSEPRPFSVSVPIPPGGYTWRQLEAASTVGDAGTPADPFAPLVLQSITSLLPAIDALVSRADATADDVFTAGELVATAGADIEAKIHEEAAGVRDYVRALVEQVHQDTITLREGHLTAPEPSIVDTVSVVKNQQIEVGAPIATLHPVFRYRLEVEIPSNLIISRLLLPGTPLRWKLTCPGPLPTTFDQRRMITTSANPMEIVNWLATVKQLYLQTTTFEGTIDYVDQDPTVPESPREHPLVIKVSFVVPEGKRLFELPANAFSPADPVAVSKTMADVGLQVSLSSDKITAKFQAGPLLVGDRCSADFYIPTGGNDVDAVESSWQRLTGSN